MPSAQKRKYFGKHRAMVLDNNDFAFDGKRRRRIKVDVLAYDIVSTWALPCNGYDWLPEKGELVWVEFEMGDINFPIWIDKIPNDVDADTDFTNPVNYNHEYRKFKDYVGNFIKYTKDEGFDLGGNADFGILINGEKQLTTQDLAQWITDYLLPWLMSHEHIGNMGTPTPLKPSDLLDMTNEQGAYDLEIAPGGDYVTNHLKAE